MTESRSETSLASARSEPAHSISGMHRNVNKAVFMMWNNQYKEAEAILVAKKDSHPRYALEWANLMLVKTLMSSTNNDREVLLDMFKEADNLAGKAKYSGAQLTDDDDDDESDINSATENTSSTPSAGDAKLKVDRKKDKKAYKARVKEAKKNGDKFDDTWKIECDVIHADALLLRAICQLMMNSYIKGGINLRKAWGCFHSLIELVENDTAGNLPEELRMCIKYGTGTFYAFLALVPANLMKLLSLIGFISDKDLGEQYLTEVFESNTIRSPFAALVLCTLYLFLPTGLGNVDATLAKANHVLVTMNTNYPNNTYFNGYANFYYRKKGETQPAVEAITKSAENAERAGAEPLLIKYLYADTIFMDLQWSNALDNYLKLVDYLDKTKESFAYTGQVILSVAACYGMLGKDEEAMKWMKMVSQRYNPKSKNDANSPKFSARVIANPRLLPMTGVFMLYINRDLAHMQKAQGERVLSELIRVTKGKDLNEPESENMYNLFLGVIKKGCDDTEAAMCYLEKVFANEKKIPKDSMILPFTYYEAAEIEFRRGNLSAAKSLFEKGSKIKGDGNETLANRYSIAMKQLKKISEDKK